ncbi:MAG: PQQ-binding-like beta-propeller repeat protein, partial [Methanomicrobiales archaeon]|nr:PQQ-binding-like beta-propeller repeat protein [Methanomicrobiales archaeon]
MDHSRFVILRNIFDTYGSSIYKEKKKLEGLIRDLYPQEYIRERNALILTLKADVIEQFYLKIPIEQSHSQLFHELTTEYCLDPELSNWVIQAWRYALSDDKLVENQNGIRFGRKIAVNLREKCDCKDYGSFLTNYVWISDNHIGVILSLFGRHDYYFRKIDRFVDHEKFESIRSLECAKDDSQKSDHNHLILNFDVNNNCLENAINIKSTKNISISNAMLISGGKALHALTVENEHLKEKWTTILKKDYGAITPIIGKSTAVTVLYSTEWNIWENYAEPNPSISSFKVISLSQEDGKIKNHFDIPFQHNSTNSNLRIGDTFYLDNHVYEPYPKNNIVALNLKTGKIIWKSDF